MGQDPHGGPPKQVVGTNTLAVGGFDVVLLPKDALIDESALQERLTDTERKHAQGIRNGPRRDEYVRARFVIRSLTGFAGPLPRSPQGVPSWPPGAVGSITHKDGHVGLLLADGAKWQAVGVDAEDLKRMKNEFESRLASANESALLDRLTVDHGRTRTDWLALIFSIKEALFKSHFPLGGLMFYFLDAETISVDPRDESTGDVSIRVLHKTSPASPAGSVWHGAYRFHRLGDHERL